MSRPDPAGVAHISTTLGLPEWVAYLEQVLATKGLAMVLWVVGGILLSRFIRWIADRYEGRVDRKFQHSDAIVRTEDAKHRRALVDVVAWSLIVIISIIVFLQVMSLMGISTSSLVGPTAVIGAALGFGAQRVVQDVLAGFFVVAERQYGYGDLVCLQVGSAATAEGPVEDVTLRVTKLRTSDGEMITVPNGQVVKVNNLSREWARSVVDVPVPADADVGRATDVLREVGKDFFDDPAWHKLMLSAPEPLGVTGMELDSVTIRMVARTLPGKQFEIGRALRVRIVQGLANNGIITTSAPVSPNGNRDAHA
ncbi:MAG: mechanosensitive ion channel family protein [Gordonia sp. (in: high G+C Gram-positive bacteria)]|uniref:mechanosensitive ion channel family protein n=1 Tax=Gordonia sp. (in: high G+C Gram-positive bacteria) TaxID=84139 RepID=UPI003BB63855